MSEPGAAALFVGTNGELGDRAATPSVDWQDLAEGTIVPVAGEQSTRRESCERAACNRGVNLRVNKRGAAELSIKSIKVPCAVDDVRGELLTRSMEVNPGLADAEKTCRMQAARNSFSFLASPAFGSRSHFLGATSVLHPEFVGLAFLALVAFIHSISCAPVRLFSTSR
jgi:hypothetical protein